MSPLVASRRLHLLLLGSVLLVGAVLRFTALGQGIPFEIGVDEPEILERAVRMMKTGDFHPHFFDYPGLYIYIQFLTACVRFLTGSISGLWANLSATSPADFYLWGRAVTALFGSATVLLVYLGARRISPLAGLLSAALIAVQSMHVRESHYILTDVPTTFFVTLSWLLSLRAFDRRTAAAFCWAGVAAGLAAATKYNGGVAILFPVIVLAITAGDWRWTLRALAAVVGGAGLAFLAGAPYTVLALPEFLDAFASLSHMYAVGGPPPEPGWLIYFKHLRLNVSVAGLLAVAAGLLVAARHVWQQPRSSASACWASAAMFAGLYFWMISGQRLIWGRYLIPLLPFLCVLAGGGLAAVMTALRTRIQRTTIVAPLAAMVLVGVGWVPATSSISSLRTAMKTGTAEQTYRWLTEHLPKGAKVGIEGRGLLMNPEDYRVENLVRLSLQDFSYYQSEEFEYLVASSRSFGRPLYEPPQEADVAVRYRELFRQLELLATFVPDRTHPGEEWRVYRVPTS